MNKVTRVMSVSIVVNLFLSCLKIISGFLGSSGALIADGIHSLSDLMTDFIAVAGSVFSSKPADLEHPYGHGNFEYLTSIMISLIIFFLGGSIIYEAFHKEVVIPTLLVFIVSTITILLKYLLSRYILIKGKEYHSHILIASGKESSTDVLSSIVVLLSTLLMQCSKYVGFLKYADKITMFLIGLFIIKVGFEILIQNINLLLGMQEVDEEITGLVQAILLEDQEVYEIEDFVLMKYGTHYKLNCSLHMDPELTLKEAHDLTEKLEEKIHNLKHGIKYITIHMEPNHHND